MILVAHDMATRLTLEATPDNISGQPPSFVMPDSTPSADELIARVQAQCTQSLADVDRLLDYIQASLLLAHWYIVHGRVVEGQYTSAVVNRYDHRWGAHFRKLLLLLTIPCKRFIINCQLHQIDGIVMQEMAPGRIPLVEGASRWDGSLLGRPRDREELAIRISVFWQVRLVPAFSRPCGLTHQTICSKVVFPRQSHSIDHWRSSSLRRRRFLPHHNRLSP